MFLNCDAFFGFEDFLSLHLYVYTNKHSFLVMQSKDPRFHALPLASQRVAAFADAVNELVYNVLISKVRQRFSDVSRLPIWSSVEEQSAFHLPTFSAYPQSYVTSVGEYLLTLPQQLEPLAEGIATSDVNNEEAQFFATEWMFKVTNLHLWELNLGYECSNLYILKVVKNVWLTMKPVLITCWSQLECIGAVRKVQLLK